MMATKKTRINITCEEETIHLLTEMANKQERSMAGFAKELILEALEKREDVALSRLAKIRDIETAKRISHNSVWE